MNQYSFTSNQIEPRRFALFALAGAVVALGVISLFVFGADNPNPDWPANWKVKPLLLTPVAGAVGGAFFYFMTCVKAPSQALRILRSVVGILGFVVALWIGIVLGLNGTMWD
ncbi:potassium transporter KefB [Flavobacterium selenitireducens]|uniref:potassium transporter KefB n=1 Tax=Flavobacterium selenitireducens TaxID=2722704 RepID=UPI00168B747A|nr:potassium transporter KefB [Flavobacterium selenitireducens]MBD3581207.1 potassium transporter KefB [Flavobacterium selenitireducens]